MRITIRQLQIFIAVGRTGTTTAAADRISLSQSAVSAALNELESLLETRLFDRVGNRLVLNDVGRSLLPQAELLVDGASSLVGRFAHGVAGASTLRLGASATIGNYIMPMVVSGFHAIHPETRIAVRIGDIAEIATAVASLEIDMGFIEGACQEVDLLSVPWISDEVLVVSSPAHALAQRYRGDLVPLEALQDADWLLREKNSGTREIVEQMLIPHLRRLKEGMVFGSAEALRRATAYGLGLSCLSSWAIQEQLRSGDLIALNTPIPQFVRRFYIIYHQKKEMSEQLRRLLVYCETLNPFVER